MLDAKLIDQAESVPSADKEEGECAVCGEYLYRESLGWWEDDKGGTHEDISPWMDEGDRDKLDAGRTPDGKLVCSLRCRSQAMYDACDSRADLQRLLGLMRETRDCIDRVRAHVARWEGAAPMEDLKQAMRGVKLMLGVYVNPQPPEWTEWCPLAEGRRAEHLQSAIRNAIFDLKWTPMCPAQVALQIRMQARPDDDWSIREDARGLASLGRILLDMQAALDEKD